MPRTLMLEDVQDLLVKQATGYIAGRRCEFSMRQNTISEQWYMEMKTDEMTVKRELPSIVSADQVNELLDVAMVRLTHMAVQCGLIETTPKELSHNITITGDDWQSTEVQIDGHTLRGVHSLQLDMKAGQEHTLKLGFSRSRIHLDQQFLPRNMQIEVEGMASVLELLRAVAQHREDGFKDGDTGLEFGKLHSGEDEVELFREVYEALRLYEAVMDDPQTMENESGAVH